MSLVQGSLEFLAENLISSKANMDQSARDVRERSARLQQYRTGPGSDSFEVATENSKSLVESNIPCVAAGPSFPPHESNFDSSGAVAPPNTASPPDRNLLSSLPLPQLPGVDADILKNLLMSWFYAGYYTAKAEGPLP